MAAEPESLEQRVEQLEKDLSFFVRYVELSKAGHATVREHTRASEIADRQPRWPAT